MIQFNLLPDVKLEYIKATYKRRIITLFSIIIAGAFLFVFILMFLFVRVNQTSRLSSLDDNIEESVTQLREENPDLDKILTIQNQLNTLPRLHDQKVISSRLFDYLTQVTPEKALISSVDMDAEGYTMIIKGTADSIITINQFVDTLKFTDFKLEGNDTRAAKDGRAFSSVVLQGFNLDPQGSTGDPRLALSYEISLNYDEAIFVNTAKDGKPLENAVKLTVPKIITTRSELQKPSSVFHKNTNDQAPTGDGSEL